MRLFEWLGQWIRQLFEALADGRTLAVLIGSGFAVLSIALYIYSRTKWGRAKPLSTCIALSVVAHILFLMYAYGTRMQINGPGSGDGNGGPMRVSMDMSWMDNADSASATAAAADAPWNKPSSIDDLPMPSLLDSSDQSSQSANDLSDIIPETQQITAWSPPAPEIFDTPPAEIAEADPSPLEPLSLPESGQMADYQTPSPDESLMVDQPLGPMDASLNSISESTTSPFQPVSSGVQYDAQSQQMPTLSPTVRPVDAQPIAAEYQLRTDPNRAAWLLQFGGDAATESAVNNGLRWLAAVQEPDGFWNAEKFGSGRETYALNEDRQGTGKFADTGITGLALLAFLGSGHTHVTGEYQNTVRRALESLINAQMPSGDLSGPKQIGSEPSRLFARMYCHGMATLALGEAYGLTGDPAIRPALLKAAQFTINAQDQSGGGWRYRPGDKGDMSQFGWQAMALQSCERGGIAIPDASRQGMAAFLKASARGNAGGLAVYRPDMGEQAATTTMTAEALACRLLLNMPPSVAAEAEAKKMILSELPGTKEDNFYFWYYGSIALFQYQDAQWQQWNNAMKNRLVSLQEPNHSPLAGSWQPDTLWGGYGGRIYSTAMACLCLEVYYRYLPMYHHQNIAGQAMPPVR